MDLDFPKRFFKHIVVLVLRKSPLYHRLALLLLCCLLAPAIEADEANRVRVGALKFGTVSWELDVVLTHGLAARKGVDVVVVPLASKSATQVAIQGDAVDVIVTDWVWVSRQRAEGRDYTFAPYSTALGAVMVDPKSGIVKLADLKGKRLGVAGGPVDKSWLLLRAHGRRNLGEDMAKVVTPSFAAPPLLNELALRGELPAVLNFWHYAARLEAAGMTSLISVNQLLEELGVETKLPMIGWVFHEQWASSHKKALLDFLSASMEAKKLLAESDSEWERLRPLLRVSDDAEVKTLRNAYRDGIPKCFGEKEIRAAEQVYEILAKEGGRDLVGSSPTLSEGTFWKDFEPFSCPR
jgi:NitT/TauT family transport system substrate-binding protein